MSIVPIEYGSLASSDIVNKNFEYLDDRIDTFNKSIMSVQANISSVNSNLTQFVQNSLESIYPVGSVYIGIMETCPLAALFGTWEKISEGRVLQGADEEHEAGTTIAAGLPHITGSVTTMNSRFSSGGSGAFAGSDGGRTGSASAYGGVDYGGNATLRFDASNSNSIYGESSTVQPSAYVVNIWRRTA